MTKILTKTSRPHATWCGRCPKLGLSRAVVHVLLPLLVFKLPPGDLLRDAVYRRLWSAILVSLARGQITVLAILPTAAVLLNASPTQMGLLQALEVLPFALFGAHGVLTACAAGLHRRRGAVAGRDWVGAAGGLASACWACPGFIVGLRHRHRQHTAGSAR